MVLSNKKLKQRLREELAKSSATKQNTDVQDGAFPETLTVAKLNRETQNQSSFKELLQSSTRKPRLSKREIRRTKAPPTVSECAAAVENGNCGGDGGGDNGKSVNVVEKMKKKKKRKRNEEEDVRDGVLGSEGNGDLANGEKAEERNEKKDKKKNKKKKKKKHSKKEKKEEAIMIEEDKETELGREEGLLKEVEKNNGSTREDSGNVPTKVYVGGIPFYSTEDDIRSYFGGCGTITEVDCMMFPETGNFRGIAIISFKTEAAAKRALALDGADMGGRFLKIQPCKVKRSSKTSDFAPEIKEGYNRVYVGNLPWDITEDELKPFFSGCNISSMRFGTDKETGSFKGFAHIDFADKESLTKALKLDQKLLSGRNIVIRCAVPLKKASISSSSLSLNSAANNGELSSVSDKARRRTCLVCKQKGHESSNCPSLVASASKQTETAPPIEEASNGIVLSVSRKARKRTCLLCRQRGHEMSTCPTRVENN